MSHPWICNRLPKIQERSVWQRAASELKQIPWKQRTNSDSFIRKRLNDSHILVRLFYECRRFFPAGACSNHPSSPTHCSVRVSTHWRCCWRRSGWIWLKGGTTNENTALLWRRDFPGLLTMASLLAMRSWLLEACRRGAVYIWLERQRPSPVKAALGLHGQNIKFKTLIIHLNMKYVGFKQSNKQ